MKTNYQKAETLWQTVAALKLKAEITGDAETVEELNTVLIENRPQLPIDEIKRLTKQKTH